MISISRAPPPDLALEVERTSASLDKLAIYAALGVPEVWRLTRQGIRMYWLAGNRYEESSISRAFPFLTVETLSRFIEEARRDGGRKATRAFRVWVREHGRR